MKKRKIKGKQLIKTKIYCSKHDSYYDENGEWLEKKCDDSWCTYCAHRWKKHLDSCECLRTHNPCF